LVRAGALAGFVGLCGLACSGSDGLNPVQGKVIYKDQPLAGALVTFHPKGATDIKTERPVGRTKEDGTFTLQTGQKEGAPTGQYVVTIICPQPLNKKATKQITFGESEETVDILGGRYADSTASQIPATIKGGQNQLEPFNLK
jgi:hypothetical protein